MPPSPTDRTNAAHGAAPGVTIRPARAADRHALVALRWALNLAEIAATEEGSPRRTERDPGRGAAEEAVGAILAAVAARGGELLVAEAASGEVVGCVYWHPEEASPSLLADARRHALLGGLAVAEAARGQGLGRALMAEAERRIAARGFRRIVLGLVAGNDRAEALYRGRGYQPILLTMARWL